MNALLLGCEQRTNEERRSNEEMFDIITPPPALMNRNLKLSHTHLRLKRAVGGKVKGTSLLHRC